MKLMFRDLLGFANNRTIRYLTGWKLGVIITHAWLTVTDL